MRGKYPMEGGGRRDRYRPYLRRVASDDGGDTAKPPAASGTIRTPVSQKRPV